MASKLFAPFKKFPQQLPIFKKSTDKFKDVSMSNYNSVYGILDDVTCNCFDNDLNLLALGTKKGEIKIFGSPGMVYTLVNSPLKSISFLRFLDGQGRIISINSDNEMVLWEYKVETSNWLISSTLLLSNQIANGKVTSFDVSHSFSWKSDTDDLLELLVIGSNTNLILQILIIGSRFHFYDGDDLSINSEHVLTKCQDLDKDFDFGGVYKICFHPTTYEKFFVSFNNGLILIMDSKVENNDNITENKDVNEITEGKENEEAVKVENEILEHDKQVEEIHDIKSAETQDAVDIDKEKIEDKAETTEKADDEIVKSETEKTAEEIIKPEELKQEIKKIKESIQVPYVNVQIPTIINYILSNKKVNDVCWTNNRITIISDNINLYEINGNNLKLTEQEHVIDLPDNFQTGISKYTYFDFKGDKFGVFITRVNEKQNLLVLLKDDKLHAEIETSSHITDYIIVRGHVSDDEAQLSHILLILCESQLIAIDLECENLTELKCPYLALRNTSQITSLTSIIQTPAHIFSNSQTVNDVFKDWPLKSHVKLNDKGEEDTSIDIFATGHADGSINIWQVLQSGVICLLIKVDSSDIFNQTSAISNSISDVTATHKKVGYNLIESEDSLLQITTIQLMLHSTSNFSESSSNELFCIAGNASGSVLVFKYDRSDSNENFIEISADFDKEGINWIDPEAPELLNKNDISHKLPKLNYIVKLNPSLPITAMAFQPTWELLSIGCTYGLVLVDFRQNKCVFSHPTVYRPSKTNNVVQPPLTVGQQLKKSIRQSFRKLKKLKPATKHTYTVNEEKSKDKEENKPVEKDDDKESTKPEEKEASKPEDEENTSKDNQHVEESEEKPREENKDNIEEADNTVIANDNTVETAEAELITIDISRKDKPVTTVGSLLIVNTSLTSTNKIPCLFAGTNIGAIYAFEITFSDEADENITVKLSKELHLQHKAPILLMSITNANHVPLIGSHDQIGSFQRKFKNTDDLKNDDDKLDNETNTESKVADVEIGPSGDSSNTDDAKQKSGTLPSPVVQDEAIGPIEGARRSVDSSKDKINISNVNMKKSGTLPASFLQAIGKSQGSSDSHELLVVSEEQVKLFCLPSLKAKYKYKVVDTGHHFSHSKTAGSQETEPIPQEKKSDNINVDIQTETQTSRTLIRRISSVGLCKMHGLKTNGNKWGVSIALTNGEIVALQISNLKKYLSNVFNYSTSPLLAGISNGELNLITSYAHRYNIQITDFSQTNSHRYEPCIVISIPKTARPVIEEKLETEVKITEAVEEVKEHVEAEPIVNGHHDIVNGHDEEEEKDQMGDEAVVQNASAVHHGDITMDSIKEYITNLDGNVTIKTFESSKEKQITVDGGQIVTTIHEKQITDGEITKDDVVKITSDTRASNELSLKE